MSNERFDPGEKVESEAVFRKKILLNARLRGCEVEVRRLLNKFDRLRKNCKNDEERRGIAQIGIAELHKLMDCYGGLTIDGKVVIPPEEEREAKLIHNIKK